MNSKVIIFRYNNFSNKYYFRKLYKALNEYMNFREDLVWFQKKIRKGQRLSHFTRNLQTFYQFIT